MDFEIVVAVIKSLSLQELLLLEPIEGFILIVFRNLMNTKAIESI
jgi:hypothetical protein